MIVKRYSKNKIVRAVFGCLFGIMMILSGVLTTPVYADPVEEDITEVVETEEVTEENVEGDDTEEEGVYENAETKENEEVEGENQNKRPQSTCERSLESIGWLVCPTTGKVAEAVDWLYEKIEKVLVINPVEMKDGSPIYEVWKYIKGITNIIFIIFLLVTIYSQLTGVGISNYGIKKALPKLIIAAILVNLSFVICSLAVDVSNIIGQSLRGVFTAIEESTIGAMDLGGGQGVYVLMAQAYSALAGGVPLAIGAGVIAFETGAIWMLIPTVLGAIVAVVTGLVTIALRQAVVALLIMIAPMAIVAYILPNTEEWFKKWKKLLIRMLVFYPMFSLLFGASSLAGFAIITSATDGFWVLVGIAVQIFPLFFSWSLMKMSGTVLGTINTKMRGLVAKPLASTRSWAESHRESTKMRYLASDNVYTPSLYLRQYLSDRKIHREEETKENAEIVKNRGLAYGTNTNYDKNGKINREGERAYRNQARNMQYQRTVLRHKNNFNEGLAQYYAGSAAQKARLEALDKLNMDSSYYLKMETARGELIDYRNAVGFHERMEDALNAHNDEKYGYTTKDGVRVRKDDYKFHFDDRKPEDLVDATERYKQLSAIMHGQEYDARYAAGFAAHLRDTQQKIHDTKLNKYAELLPPTRDVEYALDELINGGETKKNIDAIISFMQVLNQRGDTDLITEALVKIYSKGVDLGTHESQALSNFMMFGVKDADPFIRRLGKYMNLETAQVFNKNKRKNRTVTLEEYVTGQYMEPDPLPDDPDHMKVAFSKRPLTVLIEGTSLDGIERTAMKDADDFLKIAYKKDDKLDLKKFFDKRDQIEKAFGPQFISACLKYLSGSEQLKSAVAYKTGYTAEMVKDENGTILTDENGDPLYEWKAIWEKSKDDGNDFWEDPDYAKKHYRDHTLKYIDDQTPIQILKLRSDFYDGLREHLADSFEMNKEKDLTEEELRIKREYEKERAEIQTKYGDKPVGKAKRERDAALKKARHKIAGAQFRKILEARGTLEQVYRSRRSGAANEAKPWVRDWLGLDDEVAIRRYEVKKREERLKADRELEEEIKNKEEQKKKEPEIQKTNNDDDETPRKVEIYDEAKRRELQNYISYRYEEMVDEDDEEYFEETRDYLIENLSAESYIVNEYMRLHKEDPYADSHTMRDWLLWLLSDPNNY